MKLVRVAFLLSFFLFQVLLPPAALAQQPWRGRCVAGYTTTPQGSVIEDPQGDVATIAGLECLLANVLATFMTILGIAAFVMFIIGSFQYLTAGSNTKGVETGKNSITFAIAGIILALASYVILRFLSDFTGIPTILNFEVPDLPAGGP